jgi:hypothetical protein
MSDDDKKKVCELPFWRDFSVLFKDFSLQFRPNCPHSAWNFGARLILISLFVGMIASAIGGLPALAVTLMFGTFTALAIIFTTKIEEEESREAQPAEVTAGKGGWAEGRAKTRNGK